MNNLNLGTANALLNKNVFPFIKENGKYGIVLIVAAMAYDLANKAIDQGYEVDVQIGEDKLDLKLTKPQVA